MRRCVLFVVGLLATAVSPGAAQMPDFSGMWTLDRDASEFTAPAFSGGRGGDDIDRLFITHAANGTLIVGTETNGLKAWSYTPGRELTIPVGRDTTMRAASRWDGARLIAEGRQGDHGHARGDVAQPGPADAHHRDPDHDAGGRDQQPAGLHAGAAGGSV